MRQPLFCSHAPTLRSPPALQALLKSSAFEKSHTPPHPHRPPPSEAHPNSPGPSVRQNQTRHNSPAETEGTSAQPVDIQDEHFCKPAPFHDASHAATSTQPQPSHEHRHTSTHSQSAYQAAQKPSTETQR